MESTGIACAPNWESSAPSDLSYEVYLLFFGLIVPLTIILWSYTKILLTVRRVSAKSFPNYPTLANEPCFFHLFSTEHSVFQQVKYGVCPVTAEHQKRSTRMVALMISCFLIAWLPYALVSVTVMTGHKHVLSETATLVPQVLAKSSLIYNPIIYAFMNRKVRLENPW